MSYRLNIDSISVASGGVGKQYKRGDHLDDVRPGVLDTMIRLGQAVPESEFIEVPKEVTEPMAPKPERRLAPDPWKLTVVSSLVVNKKVKAALAAVGLETVADILAFGAGHGTLTTIDGINESAEKAIQDAIEKIAK